MGAIVAVEGESTGAVARWGGDTRPGRGAAASSANRSEARKTSSGRSSRRNSIIRLARTSAIMSSPSLLRAAGSSPPAGERRRAAGGGEARGGERALVYDDARALIALLPVVLARGGDAWRGRGDTESAGRESASSRVSACSRAEANPRLSIRSCANCARISRRRDCDMCGRAGASSAGASVEFPNSWLPRHRA